MPKVGVVIDNSEPVGPAGPTGEPVVLDGPTGRPVRSKEEPFTSQQNADPLAGQQNADPYWQTADRSTVRLYQGDVLDVLRRLPTQSIHCCITSPPYWGLRDYGTGIWEGGDHHCTHQPKEEDIIAAVMNHSGLGLRDATQEENERSRRTLWRTVCERCGAVKRDQQLGSESRPDCLGWARGENCAELDWANGCYVCRMVLVFREVRRVLRDDGTLWLNLGDTYANTGACGGGSPVGAREYRETDRTRQESMKRVRDDYGGLKSGNLVGVPWRVARALQADGWVLRQDIVWCLSGGTWVYAQTQKGEMPMMLRDAARLDPMTVKLWNGDKWTQVIGWSCTSRNADELELVLRSGERISCTPNHQFPTERGLLKSEEIQVGDVLGYVELPEPKKPYAPEAITLEAAWFIGLYLAEGSRSYNSDGTTHFLSIAGHAKEVERWERVRTIAAYYGGSATLTVSGNGQTIRVYGRMLIALVDDHLNGKTAHDKSLKVRCWQYSNAWLTELLLGYLYGDGHWDGKNDRWRLGFARNYSWERDLRVLAARLGFRLILNPSFADCQGQKFPTFRGEIRFNWPIHWNARKPTEVVEIRKARCREVYDVAVADPPNLFALASGVLTHNSKPAPMPESVRNRCTKAHEYVFLLTKGTGYFYDMEAIKERSLEPGRSVKVGYKSLNRYSGGNTGNAAPGVTEVIVPTTSNKRSVWSIDNERALLDWLAANAPDLLEQYLTEDVNKADVWTVSSQGYPGAHFACVDSETEALTSHGWKKWDELREGELIAAYQTSSKRLRWEPLNAIASYTYSGELCVLGGRDLGFRITPNHRCLTRTRAGTIRVQKAEDLKGGLSVPTSAEWLDGTYGREDDPGPLWAELIGWILAEGNYLKYSICVYQSMAANPEKVVRIRWLLNELGIDFKEYLQKRQWNDRRADVVRFSLPWETASKVRSWIPGKKPRWDMLGWSKESLQALWDSLIDGDGHRRKDGRVTFIQKDERTASWFQALSLRLGKRAIMSKRAARNGCYAVYTTKRDWHSLRGPGGNGSILSLEKYEGVVWCPSVESGFWLARRGGRVLITGNTFPPKLITPMILAGTSAKGCCADCGAPWRRVVEETKLRRERPNEYVKRTGEEGTGNSCANTVAGVESRTLGWEPTCTCRGRFIKVRDSVGRADAISAPGWAGSSKVAPLTAAGELSDDVVKSVIRYVPSVPLDQHPVVPCTVLDPFIGSGTTAVTALEHGRRCAGIDLSEQYLRENAVPRVKAFLNSRPALRGLIERPVETVAVVKRGRSARG